MGIILEPVEAWVAAYEQVLYRFAPSPAPFPVVSVRAEVVWSWGNSPPTTTYKSVTKKIINGYAEFDFQQILQDVLKPPIPTQTLTSNLFNPLSPINFAGHNYGYITYAIHFYQQWIDPATSYLTESGAYIGSSNRQAVRGGFQYNEDKSYLPYYNGALALSKVKFLTHYPQGTISYAKKFPKCIGRNEFEWLYAIVSTNTNSVQINGYDETGINLLGTQFINNSVVNQLVSFGAAGGSIVSSIIALNPLIRYYSVTLLQNGGADSSVIWYKVTDCPTPLRVHWLNPLGGVDSYSFCESYNDHALAVTGEYYQQSLQYYDQIGTGYNYADAGNVPIRKDGVNSFTVYAFDLAPEVRRWLVEVATSPEVYIEMLVWASGALSANEAATPTLQYIRVDVKLDEFQVNTTRESKPDLKFTFVVANDVNAQRN